MAFGKKYNEVDLTPRLLFGSAVWEALGSDPAEFEDYVNAWGWERTATELLHLIRKHSQAVNA